MGWTPQELIAVAASRLLEDRKVVFAGVGMPLVASVLAKTLHAPGLTIVLEGGIIGPEIQPGNLPISTNEMRGARQAMMLPDIAEVFLYAQRGLFDYGFLGVAQIDRHGNINTSVIGDPDAPRVRLPGSGGANDIASSCRQVLVVTTHEPRRFVERVDFVTSPGHLDGQASRQEAGLRTAGPTRVITDLALMGFTEPTREMQVLALQPGVTLEEVRSRTGFELHAAAEVRTLPPPTEQELAIVRTLDPDGYLLG
jgi:glutaconate CoA-transferase, subunit B